MLQLNKAPLRHRRLVSILSVTLLLFGVLAPAATALPPQSDDLFPRRQPDPRLGYVNGLESGTTLGGVTLPVDYAQRVSPCPHETVAAHTQTRVAPSVHPALCPGDESEAVANLQILLREKKALPQSITGVFDAATEYAVFTFHKIVGPAHSDPTTAVREWLAAPPPGDWTPEDWDMLEAFDPKPPKVRLDQPDRVEVDIGHQVLYLIDEDQVVAIIPVSTGKGGGERLHGNDGLHSKRHSSHREPVAGKRLLHRAWIWPRLVTPARCVVDLQSDLLLRPIPRNQLRASWIPTGAQLPRITRLHPPHGVGHGLPAAVDGPRCPDSRVWTGMSIHVWDA